jgi:hypothetical protein
MKIAIALLLLFFLSIAEATSLTWNPPSVGAPATYYNIYRLSSNVPYLIGSTAATTFVIDWACTADRNVFFVKAVNAQGTEGPESVRQTVQRH